jgi:GNAT superfamily N-acetyltransferase
MIAKDGDKYVGMSTVWKAQKDPKGLYQGLTGVVRDYRGQGIAVALKLKVIEFARNNKYEKLKTWLQTRSWLDNFREESGIDQNEIEAPRSNTQRLTAPDRIRTRKEGASRN